MFLPTKAPTSHAPTAHAKTQACAASKETTRPRRIHLILSSFPTRPLHNHRDVQKALCPHSRMMVNSKQDALVPCPAQRPITIAFIATSEQSQAYSHPQPRATPAHA